MAESLGKRQRKPTKPFGEAGELSEEDDDEKSGYSRPAEDEDDDSDDDDSYPSDDEDEEDDDEEPPKPASKPTGASQRLPYPCDARLPAHRRNPLRAQALPTTRAMTRWRRPRPTTKTVTSCRRRRRATRRRLYEPKLISRG